MSYKKISPLGKREGVGTWDTFFDTEKYSSPDDAAKHNDYVAADFVKDEKGTILFEIYHSKKPEDKKYHRLNFQHFPFGVDILDDSLGAEIAVNLLKINE